jgi:hypothetical protein
MVYAIVVYLHSGKQRLWLGKGAPEPACWRQAGLGTPFLLEWPAGKPALQPGNTPAHTPIDVVHDARPPPSAC